LTEIGESAEDMYCAICRTIRNIVKVEEIEGEKIRHLECGHRSRLVTRTLSENVNVSDSLGVPHHLPSAPALSFAQYTTFGAKIANPSNKDLVGYHGTTKYRLEIAAYCLELLLHNYNNDIAFAAGLTGFLVQAKSSMDSLSQEINLYFGLNIGSGPNYATDIEELTEPNHLLSLSAKNNALSQFLGQELGLGNSWFGDFKKLRDSEGVHRTRAARFIKIGKPAHDIEIGDKKVAEYCVESISRINRIIEGSYRLM